MATRAEVLQLRDMSDYREVDPYDDTQLSDMIDQVGLELAAAGIWEWKAAKYASLVNVSESGSSRNLGDAHKNALSMAGYFKKKSQDAETPVDEGRYARTRAIVREG